MRNESTKNYTNSSYKFICTFLLIMFSFIGNTVAQQKGSISGKITDKTNNEELIGASVLIVGTTTGASTDLDGTFSLRGLEAGTYQLRVSYISYQTTLINDVVVKTGQNSIVNIQLVPSTTELNEVVVSAEALKATEASVLNIQRNSLNIVDGQSAELISKNNSSDGTDVLKRMTGVTISDGKYAFIRGVGDRYNNTMLNGSNLPSADPEKRTFAYDMFPASLMENVLTSKTFIPDKPADFTGGLVEINTIEFPSRFILDLSLSTAYNSNTTFKPFNTYIGGGKDFLGIDDGTRKLPSTVNSNKVTKAAYSSEQLQAIGLSFNDNWQTKRLNAPINSSFRLNIGNQTEFEESKLGYIGSLTYSNSAENKELNQASYTFEGPRFEYAGNNYNINVNWGALFNVSYKIGKAHKFSLKNVYNNTSDNETTTYEGIYNYTQQIRRVTALRFVSRSLQSHQLIGEHHFALLRGSRVDWNINFAASERNEPDARRYIYARGIEETNQPFKFLLDQSITTRYFGNLDDKSYGGNFNIKINPFDNAALPSLKFGYTFDKKERDFIARIFGFRNNPGGNFLEEEKTLVQSVDKIFTPANINPTFIEIIEVTQPTDSYTSDQSISAAYVMTDFQPVKNIKIITGVRYEKSKQNLYSKTRTGEAVEVRSNYNDLFPSVNLIIEATESINFRLAYSRTTARPEFREIAPFTYFDFVQNELVIGNTNLKRSLITNYDVRFEYYPAPKELLAVSAYYKKFTDPIEQVLLSSSSFEPLRSYDNAKSANNFGVEFEARKALEFLSTSLSDFSFIGNLALIDSKIELKDTGFQISERPLQGQADFILNAGLYYEGFDNGYTASIIYNKVGQKIAKVGFANLGDVIEKPRDQIDLSFSKKIFNSLNLKFVVKDLLAQNYKFIQKTPNGDKVSELSKKGQTITLSLSYKLN
ncbi:MAG: TonB-dependent receptor [Ignavibacteria bacterium]|nr:MAG: TonB-dependent receptor [Ignavibacteria bacterium]KAF0160897.1 MAG: TonB-dependent receptor [Ignavibacteria bacterium]